VLGGAQVGTLNGMMLATIPVALEVTAPQPLAAGMLSPARSTLALAWLAVLGGIAAVAVTLRASIAFAMRRARFASAVTHELRTPLTAIRCKIEALQDGLMQADAESLAALHVNVLHLGRIVDDLQEISLAEAGELRLECRPLDLAQEVAALLASLAYERVESEVGDLPRVLADQARLHQVLINLLDNALTHSPPGGRVRVAALELEGALEVSVHDQGPGIDAADLPHVFERFYRGDPARNRSTGGVGLGLAIARKLVEAQGGAIRVESEPGRGTTVHFTLPLATPEREG